MNVGQHVVIDPAILQGKPVIRGTRITVELILRKLAEGARVEDLIQVYPQLTVESIQGAVAFAADAVAHEDHVIA